MDLLDMHCFARWTLHFPVAPHNPSKGLLGKRLLSIQSNPLRRHTRKALAARVARPDIAPLLLKGKVACRPAAQQSALPCLACGKSQRPCCCL